MCGGSFTLSDNHVRGGRDAPLYTPIPLSGELWDEKIW